MNGSQVGKVEDDGDVYKNGSQIGKCSGVNRAYVGAIYFFFFRDELGIY